MKRVVFMGTPAYATTILKALVQSSEFEVVGHYSQPDKPVGRKQILTPPHSKAYIVENELDIPIFQPTTFKNDEVVESLKDLNPDFIVVAAYGKILPRTILDIAPCINLHASILPKYRGASPIQDAIVNQDRLSGVTAMNMEEGLDSGDILAISYLNILNMNAMELFEKLADMAAELTVQVLSDYDNIMPQKQNELRVTHSRKITKEDGEVSFIYALELYAKYLGYIFWPGIYLKSGLKLKELELLESESINKSGEILKIEKDFVVVGCKKGSLKISSLQPPSKKLMKAVDYIRGKRLNIGDSLS